MITLRWKQLVIGHQGRPFRDLGDGETSSDRLLIVEGPNGSGKTTLLKTLGGILAPVSGTIVPPPDPRTTTFVHSTPWLYRGSVRHNLQLAGDRDTAEEEADRLEISALLDEPAFRLSAGQAQRVALARAMTSKPDILLLDEPEGSLDSVSVQRWTDRIEECVKLAHPLIVLATHRRSDWRVPVELLSFH